MKKTLKYLLFLILLGIQLSCFDVVETIKVNQDGNGSFSYIINASESATNLNSMIKMGEFDGKKIPNRTEISNNLNEIKRILADTKGISNVKISSDLNQFIIKISGNFKHVEYLDNAIRKIKSEKKLGRDFPTNLYGYNVFTKTFEKNETPSYQLQFSKIKTSNREVFTKATFTSIFQFDTPIKSINNTSYEFSPSRKSLKISGKLIDFINEKKQPQIAVKL